MAAPEVVVTGAGMVTPLGGTAAECVRAWRHGAAAERRALPELSATPLADRLVARPAAVDAAARLGGRRLLKYMSDAAVLGCVAAHEAMQGACVHGRIAPQRIGLFGATGLAAARIDEIAPLIEHSIDAQGELSLRLLGERGLAQTNPLLSFKILANIPACIVSILEDVRGPSYVFTPWEGQGGAAFLEAHEALASGEVDAALVGATDDATHAVTIACLAQRGVLGPDDVTAAGAAYLVLERRADAERAGAPLLARVRAMALRPVDVAGHDPLGARLGRTLAAAPAIAFALQALGAQVEVRVAGADRQEFTAELEVLA